MVWWWAGHSQTDLKHAEPKWKAGCLVYQIPIFLMFQLNISGLGLCHNGKRSLWYSGFRSLPVKHPVLSGFGSLSIFLLIAFAVNVCFPKNPKNPFCFFLSQWIYSQELLGYNLRFRKVSGVLTELLALSGCSSQDLDQCTFPTEHIGLEVWSTILDTGDWKDISKQLGGASAVLLGSVGYTGCWDLLSEGVYTRFDCAYCWSDMFPLCLCIAQFISTLQKHVKLCKHFAICWTLKCRIVLDDLTLYGNLLHLFKLLLL